MLSFSKYNPNPNPNPIPNPTGKALKIHQETGADALAARDLAVLGRYEEAMALVKGNAYSRPTLKL